MDLDSCVVGGSLFDEAERSDGVGPFYLPRLHRSTAANVISEWCVHMTMARPLHGSAVFRRAPMTPCRPGSATPANALQRSPARSWWRWHASAGVA